MLKLVGVMSEHDIELLNLETEEPNLERVFLHLTGRGLRDAECVGTRRDPQTHSGTLTGASQ